MTAAVNIAQGGTNNVSWRNRIINGAMVIDQRNAGASVTNTTSQVFAVDRFSIYGAVSSKFTGQQNAGSVTPPAGFTNYLGCTSSSAYSVGSGESFSIYHIIEGFNISDLNWGTASAQSVTLSFWARSSLTGTFSVTLRNNAQTRSYPATYTINSANTWEYKTITVPGETSGAWAVTNGVGVSLIFNLGSGSAASTTGNAWASANFVAATGATSVVGTNGATFYITGVQLEKGTAASPFEYRDYGRELIMCQRYTYVFNGTTSNSNFGIGRWEGNNVFCQMIFPVVMRTVPTITAPVTSGLQAVDPTVAWYNISALSSVHKNGVLSADLYFTVSGASVANKTFAQVAVNSGTPQVVASAEL